MAFQFQAVAALSPLLMEAFGIGLADAAGDAGMAILAGAGMSFAAAVCLLFFRRATV